jgi:transcriptional regulator with XRE-family HTH domain
MGETPLLLVPADVRRAIAKRVRLLRIQGNWKQQDLASRAGISLRTLNRFERTGAATVDTLLRVAHALGRLADFASVLQPPPIRSLSELEPDRPPKQRVRQSR